MPRDHYAHGAVLWAILFTSPGRRAILPLTRFKDLKVHYPKTRIPVILMEACLIAVISTFAGCGGHHSKSVDQTQQTLPNPYRWTVLIYMCGDNNLESVGLQNINDMEKVGSTPFVKVLIQLKRSSHNSTADGDWNGARRYEVNRDSDNTKINSLMLQELGDIDMGSAASLKDFILWGQSYAPADRYMLILWDHGTGWDPNDDAPAAKAISQDDTYKTMIKIPDLPSALGAGKKFDIIACDACLMSMFEVIYEVHNYGDYFVASEEETPIQGFAYDQILGYLTSQQGIISPTKDTAIFMAKSSFDYWKSWSQKVMSVVDLNQANAVAQALNTFSQELIASGNSSAALAAQAESTAQRFSTYYRDPRVDLGDYVSIISDGKMSDAVRTSANNLRSAINSAVVANYFTDTRSRATGISAYIPTAGNYLQYGAPGYRLLSLANDTQWDEWLAYQGGQ